MDPELPLPAQDGASALPAGRAPLGAAAMLTYATSLAVGALSLLNVLVMSRVLGPEGRGQVVLLTTLAGLAGFAFSLSVHEANSNVAAQEPETRRALAGNSIVFAVVLGAVGAGVVIGGVALVPSIAAGVDPRLVSVATIALPIAMLQVYLTYLVRADYGFGMANAATVLVPGLNLLLNGALAAIGLMTVTTALVVWIAAQLAATTLLAWFLMRRLAGFGRPDGALAARSARFGAQTHVSGLLAGANTRLDQLLVASFAGTKELGIYSVATAWVEALFLLPFALANVVRPDLARGATEDSVERATRTTRLALLVTIPLTIAMVVIAPFLCVTLFGDEFRDSISALRLMVPGAFGIVLIKVLGSALIARNRPLLEGLAVAAAFVVTVVGDVLLIPHYGADGAALVSTIAYTTAGFTVALIFTRTLGRGSHGLMPRRSDLAVLGAFVANGAARVRRRPR